MSEWKLNVAVCDDIEKDSAQIADMTARLLQTSQVAHDIACYASAAAILDDIRGGAKFHILILDVMMDEMDGMELAAELRRQENNAAIIFISVNREMAMQGYEVSAVRYLAKPLDEHKLKEALQYCCRQWQDQKEILLPTDNGERKISFTQIQFVEAFDRGTRFVFANEVIESRLKFSQAEALLPKSLFLLCHRAFIVNLSLVKAIRNYEFELTSGQVVPIGKRRYPEVYKRFVDYIAD